MKICLRYIRDISDDEVKTRDLIPDFKPTPEGTTFNFRTHKEQEGLPIYLGAITSPGYFIQMKDYRGYRDHRFTVEWDLDGEITKHHGLNPSTCLKIRLWGEKEYRELPFTHDKVGKILRERGEIKVTIWRTRK